jgi:hypothetical protein
MPELPTLHVAAGDHISGFAEVQLFTNATLDAAGLRLIERGIAVFVEAGAQGGYPVSSIPPQQSSMALADDLTSDSSGAHFVLQAREITRNSLQLLRHILSKPELPECELMQIQVHDRSGHSMQVLPEIDEYNEPSLYPAVSSHLEFSIEYGEDDFAKSRRVEVEFFTPTDISEIESIESYVVAWGSLLEAGAFALPYGLPDVVESVMGQVRQFDTHSVEIEVPVYSASEEGWNVLMNMLHMFSKKHRAIARLLAE